MLISGQDLTPEKYSKVKSGIPYITGASNLEGEEVIFNRWTTKPVSIANSGDLLLTCKGTVGKIAFLKHKEAHIARQIMAIRAISNLALHYVKAFLIISMQKIKSDAKSMIPGISREVLLSILIPLPPLAEQQRIVDKLERLLPSVERYKQDKEKLDELNLKFPSRLKKSIIDYAIKGKLVKQDKKDESVEILLQKIKKQKDKLIKEKKIKPFKFNSTIFKHSDNSHYEKIGNKTRIIQDEIPFEIPDSWAWVRLGDVAEIYTGDSINQDQKLRKYTNLKDGRYYIATKDVGFNGTIDYENGVKIPQNETKFKAAPKDSILLCIEGGSAGKKIGYLESEVCFGNKLCCFTPFILHSKFIFYYLQSSCFLDFFRQGTTGIITGVNLSQLKTILIPLPPLSEQRRIVAKIEEILNLET
ncbi:restriction endonuclease subunit S [Campylobacter californiensis]|nr:type I restriction/modification system, S subunit [Campylobacter sp. RM6914]